MHRNLLHIIVIPLLTILVFIFESSNPRFYLWELTWSFCLSMLLWFSNGAVIKFLNRSIPWRQPAAPRIIIQMGLSILLTIWIAYFAVRILYEFVYDVHFGSLVYRRTLLLFVIISLLYNAIYTGHHFFTQWRRSLLKAEELKRQNLIIQNDALKEQLNPHYLFNSLNTLIGLIDDDPEMAKQFGRHFAKMYRYVLDSSQKELTTLQEELGVIQVHKELLKSRFGPSLNIQLSTDPGLDHRQIPPLTLQMLLENVLKHNVASKWKPLSIDIYTSDRESLIVQNNLQPRLKSQVDSLGVGIDNIIRRYQFLTERNVAVRQTSRVFSVEVPLLE